MVDTKKVARTTQADKGGREQRPAESQDIPEHPLVPTFEAVVKVRREFPEITVEDAREVLGGCELNVKKAVAILKARQTIAVENDGSVRSPLNSPKVPTRRPGSSLKRKAPDLSTANNIMVQITVGKEGRQKTFAIHKSFICDASPYFNAAFNTRSPFIEAETQQMTIDFTSPEVFGLFQKWIYQNRIHDVDNKTLPSIANVVQLWVLAEKFKTPALQNLAMRGLYPRSFCDGSDGKDAVSGFTYIYQVTTPDSALRKLFIESVLARKLPYPAFSKLFDEHYAEMPKEMMKDLIFALKKIQEAAGGMDSLSPPDIEEFLVQQ